MTCPGDRATGRDGVRAARHARAARGCGWGAAIALTPDVVLMDLQMGEGMDGVSATRALQELDHPPRVLILTTYDTDADILRAVEAGAAGYLLKDAPTDKLVDAVYAAA